MTPRIRDHHGGDGRDVVTQESVEQEHGPRVPNIGSAIQVFTESSTVDVNGGLQGPFAGRTDSIPETTQVRLKLKRYAIGDTEKSTGPCVPPIEYHT